nr:LRR receptor-like serine/threonine-protein kinase FLS2 [Ipomoea trifida]
MGFSIGIATLNHDYNFELSTNDAPPKVEFIRTKEIYIISLWRQHLKIDLSANSLIGEIPFELGNLTKIHALNLSYNNLSGMIPETFSKLENIESLDLSHNELSGKIPITLFNLYCYEGNPYLCGPHYKSVAEALSHRHLGSRLIQIGRVKKAMMLIWKFSASVLVYLMVFVCLQ